MRPIAGFGQEHFGPPSYWRARIGTGEFQRLYEIRRRQDLQAQARHRCRRLRLLALPGLWRLIVVLSAGDQRMQVSFGTSAKEAEDEVAAGETFPGFNSVYEGIVEWRVEKLPNGKTRPYATILRWTTRTDADAERDDGKSTGRTLVVTRLNPGGVCHVGYVDARAPGANEAARKLADEKARSFKCGTDDPAK